MVNKLFEGQKVPTILAPMAGYTDFAFRSICRNYGVGLTVTEMVSSKALVMGNRLTQTLLHRAPNDTPSFCQIFGHEPQVMADSVLLPSVAEFQGVDINMGCPVRKIVGNGDGSALMENLPLASQCITAVKRALGSKPLSVKFRLGVADDNGVVDFAKMCRDSGADFITVHFRTRKQMYEGKANYNTLPAIAKVGLPVFANGDVCMQSQCQTLLDMGAYGVAVGRGALGKPQIFAQLQGQQTQPLNVLDTVATHAKMLLQIFSERIVVNELKKHAICYLKGMRGCKQATVAITTATSVVQILHAVETFVGGNGEITNLSNGETK